MNPFELIKNFGKMRSQLDEWGQKQKEIEAEGISAGGLVKVVAGGDLTVRKIFIDDSLFLEDKRGLLVPLLVSAVNIALKDVQEKSKQALSGMTGMDLSGTGIG